MLIGIIETGRPPESLKAAHGSYPDMFRHLLLSVADDLEFVTFAALDGEVPKDPEAADAWLITGSRHSVTEETDWMLELERFIRSSVDLHVPLVGICFGHQIIAKAMGGRVVKSDKGWGVGHHDYKVVARRPWMSDDTTTLSTNAVHEDQVVELPDGADVIATSSFCENAILAYGNSALTIQSHPEIGDPFKRALLETRLADVLSADHMTSAYETLGKPMTTDIAASWIVEFIRHARAGAKDTKHGEADEKLLVESP